MSLALGVLVSGSGSNLLAILDAIENKTLAADCRLVLSNKKDALALSRAEAKGIHTCVLEHKDFETREAFDAELVRALREAGVEWVALAGFMRVLTPVFLDAFAGKIVNIHPSLLPAFTGVNAQKQAFEYGAKVTGCSVHFVDRGVDTGPIISQRAVPVEENDTVESLRERILAQEHVLYVEALRLISEGRVQLGADGRQVKILPPGTPSTSAAK